MSLGLDIARRKAALPLTIKNLLQKPPLDSFISASGWVKSIRKQKRVAFAEINDGSSEDNLQIVLDPREAANLITGTSVKVEGALKKSAGRLQSMELEVSKLHILGTCDDTYPIQKKFHGQEFLRKLSHLKSRTDLHSSLMRLRSVAAQCFRDELHDLEFHEIHAPALTFFDCEGAGETFQVSESETFFGSQAQLTVSSQLYAEIGASSLGRVYTFGPIFRAEKHRTNRHLAEFWMLEPEISFIDSLEQLTLLIETVIKGVCSRLLERSSKDLAICQQYNHNAGQNLALLMEKPFSTISYTEAIKILSESNSSFEHQVSWSTGLQSEHEKFLAGQIFKGPLFVTDYPSHLKAFYMKSNPLAEDTGPTVACVDLLLPDVGELVGGSLREDRIDLLQKRIAQTGLNPSSLKWYLDLRRYGSVPHGGFGLGFERFLQYITGLPNIRDTCLIPRYNGNCNI